MMARIDRASLLTTGRTVEFRPGLNVIYGPISTGKTSVLRLCRILFGAPVAQLPKELMLVPGIGGRLTLGNSSYEVVRPLSQGRTVSVDIAGPDHSHLTLPSQQGDAFHPSYAQWLLGQLGLPRVEVPAAPTRPDSDPSPVSINDYFAYCDLPKEEIRSDVFGHRNVFRDIKRRYVFEIIYGQYDIRSAALQDELRSLRSRLRTLEHEQEAFVRMFKDTPWENRASLERELAEASGQVQGLSQSVGEEAGKAPHDQTTVRLRAGVQALDAVMSDLSSSLERERADQARFAQLAAQLETQMGRLTRALVANETLLDIDFVLCPRCGSNLARDRAKEGCCYLCLQPPPQQQNRRGDLVAEQTRLSAQLEETRRLVAARGVRVAELNRQLDAVRGERAVKGAALDEAVRLFVSDSAARLQELAAERGALREKERRLRDYLSLFDRRDVAHAELARLHEREAELLTALEEAKVRKEDVEQRIVDLEQRFTEILRSLSLPEFLGKPEGRIDRRTYLPSVSGRSFDALQSEGLSVEVNIAHALAHHLTSLTHGLALPAILFVDGISGAFGESGYDPARIAGIYQQIVKACDEADGALQVIVADTRVPPIARGAIVLELAEQDRLVPEAFLQKAASQQNDGV